MESRITGHTRLFGLIGSPVGHSGSPAMYNYSFAHNGLDNAYLAFDIPLNKVEEAVAAIRTFNFGGFNITMPDKAEVCKYLDDISPAAKLIGACNTVVVGEDGKLTGHNTDGIGFVRNLHEHGVEVKGKKIVLLGAGGAATAIAAQTSLDGAAKLSMFNIKDEFYEKGEAIIERLHEAVPECESSITDLADAEALRAAVADCDILVNATKVGMKPLDDQTLIDPSMFRSDLVVADTVYNPKETLMIKQAAEAGCAAAVGGIGMLLWQGAAAFKLFTGEEMPTQEVLENFFS